MPEAKICKNKRPACLHNKHSIIKTNIVLGFKIYIAFVCVKYQKMSIGKAVEFSIKSKTCHHLAKV